MSSQPAESNPSSPSDQSTAQQAARRRMTFAILMVVAVIAVVFTIVAVATRSGGSGQYSVTNGKIVINAEAVGTLGTVLVTDTGFALYSFPPDAQKGVTCKDACAIKWPPIVVPKGARMIAGDGIEASRLSTVTAPNGDTVATYDGWPLYTFQGDVAPNTATGQGQYLDGGYWYVIRPNGEIVTPKPLP